MYIDFHTHGKLAKKLPFSKEYTDWLFDEARRAGLDAICLTEHFNTLQFDELYGYIQERYDKDEDTVVTDNGLRIFAGMETDIAEGGHILSVGKYAEILEINKRLEKNKMKENFLPFESLMDIFSEYDIIVGAGHPFRAGGHIPEINSKQLERLNFIDLNGKDIAEDRIATEKKVYEFGKKLNLPVVSGSDTHQAVQYGCIKTRMFNDINTVTKLYDEIKRGNYEIEISDNAAFQVKSAGLLKKALKAIHACGGDYVSVLINNEKE